MKPADRVNVTVGSMMLAYPLLAHAAVWWHTPVLEWVALTLLAVIPLVRSLFRLRIWAWALAFVVAAGLYLLTSVGGGIYALYLPSILIPGLLLWVFASSLRPGRVPLITEIARRTRKSMSPRLETYCHRLTVLWILLFAVMVIAALGFIAAGQRELWSLQTNLLNYIACGLMFAGDHVYRVWRMREEPHPRFIEYLGIVARSGVRRP
ncbi:MAG: hypothetical protein ACREUE_13380 [Panacagrimonas sp.]